MDSRTYWNPRSKEQAQNRELFWFEINQALRSGEHVDLDTLEIPPENIILMSMPVNKCSKKNKKTDCSTVNLICTGGPTIIRLANQAVNISSCLITLSAAFFLLRKVCRTKSSLAKRPQHCCKSL